MEDLHTVAVKIAREALRGFFDDFSGFERMETLRQKQAIERVEKKLQDLDIVKTELNDLSEKDRADHE